MTRYNIKLYHWQYQFPAVFLWVMVYGQIYFDFIVNTYIKCCV